jgi:hypothetical protein
VASGDLRRWPDPLVFLLEFGEEFRQRIGFFGNLYALTVFPRAQFSQNPFAGLDLQARPVDHVVFLVIASPES